MFYEWLGHLAQAILVATAAERLIQYYVADAFDNYAPDLDTFFLRYVGLAGGGLLSWWAQLDLFYPIAEIPPLEGTIITALLVGGGTQFLHAFISTTMPDFVKKVLNQSNG